MAKQQKPPAVVAELGRPETASETAARKAHDSRMYRQRKTVNNLVFSLIVSLGLMIVIVLMAPGLIGGKSSFEDQAVDVESLAVDASAGAGRLLAAPEVPDGWKAKQARLDKRDGVVYWRIDYTTADGAYAAVLQAFTADGSEVDERWIEQQLEQQQSTGAEQMGGVDWTVYDHPDRSADESNMRFGLEGTVTAADDATNTVLVFGTDNAGTLRVLATDVVASLQDPAASTDKEAS